MGKKKEGTPRSKVRQALRALWLRSRERSAALKREKNCCEECGAKQSVAKGKEVKLEVHHKRGVEWEALINLVYQWLLCDPHDLKVLCKDCHEKEHAGGGDDNRN